MNIAPPMAFVWDAEKAVMVPKRPGYACRIYTDTEEYRLGIIEERSTNTHNHFFASLAESHSNLPDDLAERFQTVEHLRKYALIKAGYFDERSIVCASKAEASRVAAFIAPMDTYAIVKISEAVVRVFTAKSQSKKAMGAKDFADSKSKVLAIVADMIGVSADSLTNNAGRAA